MARSDPHIEWRLMTAGTQYHGLADIRSFLQSGFGASADREAPHVRRDGVPPYRLATFPLDDPLEAQDAVLDTTVHAWTSFDGPQDRGQMCKRLLDSRIRQA